MKQRTLLTGICTFLVALLILFFSYDEGIQIAAAFGLIIATLGSVGIAFYLIVETVSDTTNKGSDLNREYESKQYHYLNGNKRGKAIGCVLMIPKRHKHILDEIQLVFVNDEFSNKKVKK